MKSIIFSVSIRMENLFYEISVGQLGWVPGGCEGVLPGLGKRTFAAKFTETNNIGSSLE